MTGTMITATVKTCALPSGLKSAREAAEQFAKYGIDEDKLNHFADAGLAPHWRVNGGPPVFAVPELKAWIAENFVQRFEGRAIPMEFAFRIVYTPPPLAASQDIPDALRGLAGLCDITASVRICSGVYFLMLGSEVVYVGQSVTPLTRIKAHMPGKQFTKVLFVPVVEAELDKVEGTFIRLLRPRYNYTTVRGKLAAPHVTAEEAETIIADLRRERPLTELLDDVISKVAGNGHDAAVEARDAEGAR